MPEVTNWSRKGGVWHCESPTAQLAGMLFVRVHLDRNTEANGAMEIALGSHREGAVPAATAAATAERYPSEICEADPGDILVLSMLTLHRSRPSRSDAPRRVIRVDYAAGSLPGGLEWNT